MNQIAESEDSWYTLTKKPQIPKLLCANLPVNETDRIAYRKMDCYSCVIGCQRIDNKRLFFFCMEVRMNRPSRFTQALTGRWPGATQTQDLREACANRWAGVKRGRGIQKALRAVVGPVAPQNG